MKKRKPYQIFYTEVMDLDSLICPVSKESDLSKNVLNLTFSRVGEIDIPSQSVFISQDLFNKIGGMVYGNGDLKKYYLQLIKTMGGQYQLFVKYSHIIGSRRVASLTEESIIKFVNS